MGCFLACFGFQKGRRNRRPLLDGVTSDNQIVLSYEPLVSSRITSCDDNGKLEIQNPISRERPKEIKIRKKVNFNLNVQAYEPIPDDHYFLDNNKVVKTEEHHQDATTRTVSTSLQDTEFTISNSGNYPQNHRYQNCVDTHDDDNSEEDYFVYDESDLEDSEIDEDYDESETSNVQVHSVLKPIENLTQWRAAKAKAVGTITKHSQMQSNVNTSPQLSLKSRSTLSFSDTRMQENRVHSSLSDWLSEMHKG